MNQISVSRSFFVLLLAFFVIGCSASATSDVDKVANYLSQHGNRSRLVRWCDENVRDQSWDIGKLDLGMDASPGQVAINLPFDWSIVGLKENPGQEVRLILNAKNQVQAVYFGNPRLGVIVALNNNFGIDANSLHIIDQSVAVYSRQ